VLITARRSGKNSKRSFWKSIEGASRALKLNKSIKTGESKINFKRLGFFFELKFLVC